MALVIEHAYAQSWYGHTLFCDCKCVTCFSVSPYAAMHCMSEGITGGVEEGRKWPECSEQCVTTYMRQQPSLRTAADCCDQPAEHSCKGSKHELTDHVCSDITLLTAPSIASKKFACCADTQQLVMQRDCTASFSAKSTPACSCDVEQLQTYLPLTCLPLAFIRVSLQVMSVTFAELAHPTDTPQSYTGPGAMAKPLSSTVSTSHPPAPPTGAAARRTGEGTTSRPLAAVQQPRLKQTGGMAVTGKRGLLAEGPGMELQVWVLQNDLLCSHLA